MKSVAVINTCDWGSTGKIANNLYNYLASTGYQAVFCYGRGEKRSGDYYRIDNKCEVLYHGLLSRLFGKQGVFSRLATKRLISMLKARGVDTVFAVSLHGYYLNENMFFKYLQEDSIKLCYVMIDEYPYRGKCCVSNHCEKYLSGCASCPSYKQYPASWFFDRAASIYKDKLRNYSGLKRCCFIGPEFVVSRARKSPLTSNKELVVLDEAIDVELFSPIEDNGLKKELGISDGKVVILCVAPYSNAGKGGRYFVEAARRFEHDDRFAFVYVAYDVEEKEGLPENLITVGYVRDPRRLAMFYSMADLFVFPSLADTMPNACLEAMSCGTPLLCFDISGMPYLAGKDIMTLVAARDVDALADVISQTVEKSDELSHRCREYALSRYDNRLYNKKLVEIALRDNA